MIRQRDVHWWYKLNGLARRAIVEGALRPLFETIVVTEFPKCGGTWLSQLLAETTGLPYPRNRLPLFGSQIIHGHYVGRSRADHTVVMWRDGRDVLVSVYFHLAHPKEITSARMSERFRRELGIADPDDVERYFPRFLEWSFAGGFPNFTWAAFERRWNGESGVVFTSYEALHADTAGELGRILAAIGRTDVSSEQIGSAVDKLSFEKQAGGRKKGDADQASFVRKGIVGDWKNVFSAEAREIFDRHAGDSLIRLGYEKDRSWVARDTRAAAE